MKSHKKDKEVKKQNDKHQHPLQGEIPREQKRQNANAHHQAEHDMMDDAEFIAPHPTDDLDEGETARLGEDRTDLV
jgi:hypothetical protein